MEHRYLFLDLHHITRIEGLYRRMHQPQRHPDNPILRGENPWESVASLYGTVLYDPQDSRFKMWYLTGPYVDGMVQIRQRNALGNITLLAYATSTDGVHWEKPILDQVNFAGSTANNLVDIGRTNCEGIAVIYDEHEVDPQRRYKGFYWEHGGIDTFIEYEGRTLWGRGDGDGMWMSFSPDGIHWTNCEANPVIPLDSDTTQSLVWGSKNTEVRCLWAIRGCVDAKRLVLRVPTQSNSANRNAFLSATKLMKREPRFYGMPINIYEGIYLGMIWVYREGVDGTIDTALATSRDGINWQRVLDRQTFLTLGQHGSWEDGMARVSQNFITHNDQIYFYYGGVNGPHTGRKFKQVERKHKSMLGLATLRRDGFVSLDAGEIEGHILTKPLTLNGGELHINADASQGYVIVSVTDDTGIPLENYTSQLIAGDQLDAEVKFNHSLEALKGKKVRLRFQMKSASLYSYWFV